MSVCDAVTFVTMTVVSVTACVALELSVTTPVAVAVVTMLSVYVELLGTGCDAVPLTFTMPVAVYVCATVALLDVVAVAV